MPISPEEAKFAPVSLLDELSTPGDTHAVQDITAQVCANCLLEKPCEGHSAHCVGEGTDFDA